MTKLHDAPLLPQTIVNALNQYGPEPSLYLDGKLASYGCVITPLHPLGSFEDRATELRHHQPGLTLLALGPTLIGTDLLESARMLAPAPLQAAAAAAEDVAALLYTGDIGRFDDEGYLYIVARVKDMVITDGFNVFPREVEDVLTRHASVAAAAVIGVPDEKFGEAVKAVIKLSVGVDPTAKLTANLQERVKEAKGSVQVPKTIDYVADISLTPLGKPGKNAIRQRYWDHQDRAVS